MAFKELGLAASTRLAVKEALHRGRCGIDADSHAVPRRHARARRDGGPAGTRSRLSTEKWLLRSCESVG